MAINNPSNLYTAGAVVFDTRPSTNFAIQLLQQKKAKDEALDQYYQKLPSTINEAGMRDQDREPFMQNIGQLQAYWRDNRDKIKNPRRDGGAAQYNYEKMFRDISTRVNMSKQAAKTDLELGKLRFSENTSYIFDDPEIIDRIGKQSLNVWDPNHQTVDLATITVPPKPMAQKDWDDYWKSLPGNLKMDSQITYKADPADPYSRIPVVTSAYSKDKLAQIGLNAATAYTKNKRLATEFNKANALANIKDIEDWKDDHEALYNRYNAQFKAVYGSDIKNIPELHAAEAIERFSQPQVEEKPAVADWKKRTDYTESRQDARQSRSLAAQRERGEGSGGGTINDLYSVIDGLATQKRGEGKPYLQVNLLPADAQNVVMEFARRNTGKNDIGNDKVKIIKMDDGQVGLFQVVKKWEGGKSVQKDVLVGFLTPTAINMKVQADVKGKRGVISQGNPSPKSSTPKNNDPLGIL
jgi:hypothetical protein